MDNFIHLEVQSAYSFLWGTFTPEELVQEVVALGQKAVALTDDGLHGAVRFYKAAVQAGIQPILGARLSIWDGSPVTLLASDFEAYGNLCRLLSIALGDGTSPQVSITKQDVEPLVQRTNLSGRWEKFPHKVLAGKGENRGGKNLSSGTQERIT